MTDNTTLVQSFAKRLVKNNREITGNPDVKTEADMCNHEEVHPGLSHSQFSLTKPKHEMGAYQGGAAPAFGQGTKSLDKSLPGIYCSWCHQGPFGRYVPYKGQQVCTKCWAESGPARPFTK